MIWLVGIAIYLIAFAIYCVNERANYDPKAEKMKALFAKKFPSRTQKIKLTRAELCAKRGVKRVPKNDVMWNVYQWECTELLAKELWIDYRKVRFEMGELLLEEKKYRQALEFFLEAQYIEKCCPSYFSTKDYPEQPFPSRDYVLNLKHSGVHSNLVGSIMMCEFNATQTKEIFLNMTLANIPFPISRAEAWEIIEPILYFYIEKYVSYYLDIFSGKKTIESMCQ